MASKPRSETASAGGRDFWVSVGQRGRPSLALPRCDRGGDFLGRAGVLRSGCDGAF